MQAQCESAQRVPRRFGACCSRLQLEQLERACPASELRALAQQQRVVDSRVRHERAEGPERVPGALRTLAATSCSQDLVRGGCALQCGEQLALARARGF